MTITERPAPPPDTLDSRIAAMLALRHDRQAFTRQTGVPLDVNGKMLLGTNGRPSALGQRERT